MSPEKLVFKYREIFNSAPKVLPAHDEKGHNYVSPVTNETYKSVTYYTSFIKDPSLSNWKMNRGLEHIKQHFLQFGLNSAGLEISEFMDRIILKAKAAPEGEFQNAGSIGSAVHAWRQEWFQNWITLGVGSLPDADIEAYPLPTNVDPEVISGCRAIKRFLKETGYIPVACELALVDDELKVGGTIDDLGVFPNPTKIHIDEQTVISNVKGVMNDSDWMKGAYKVKFSPYLGFVDLKTSNQGKKPAYAYQVRGFYQRMIRKTFGIRPKRTFILHTSKADGTYKLIDLTDMRFLEKEAAYLVQCSRSWDKVTEFFKPKVVTI